MSETIKGKISRVAKTGGIQLNDVEDKWYNPSDKAKEYVKKELFGKEVELTMQDDGKFSFIQVTEATPAEGKPYNMNAMEERKTRSMALAYSKDMAVARITKGEEIPVAAIIVTAEKFREYVWEGYSGDA